MLAATARRQEVATMSLHRRLGWVALCLGAGLVGACAAPTKAPSPAPDGSSTVPTAAPGTAAPGTNPSEGQALYLRYCAACHGKDGIALASQVTPNLDNPGLLAVADDAFLTATIRNGRPGASGRGQPGTKMTEFATLLTPEQIAAIVGYLRHWQTGPSVTPEPLAAGGDAGRGGTVYAAKCATCHGADGWGQLAPRLAGSTFQASASDAFIAHTVRQGRPGTRMKAVPLTEAELADVVAFVRTLDDVPPP
jgi:cbb3-type cytochrome c oxidase subunit III